MSVARSDVSDGHRRQGPLSWFRPPDQESGTRISVTVVETEAVPTIYVDVDGERHTADLLVEPSSRPLVLELDEKVVINGMPRKALRLTPGVAQAVGDAVIAFRER